MRWVGWKMRSCRQQIPAENKSRWINEWGTIRSAGYIKSKMNAVNQPDSKYWQKKIHWNTNQKRKKNLAKSEIDWNSTDYWMETTRIVDDPDSMAKEKHWIQVEIVTALKTLKSVKWAGPTESRCCHAEVLKRRGEEEEEVVAAAAALAAEVAAAPVAAGWRRRRWTRRSYLRNWCSTLPNWYVPVDNPTGQYWDRESFLFFFLSRLSPPGGRLWNLAARILETAQNGFKTIQLGRFRS